MSAKKMTIDDVDEVIGRVVSSVEQLAAENAALIEQRDRMREALKGIEVIQHGNPEECWFLLRSDGNEIGAGSVRLTGEFAVAFSKWAQKRRAALAASRAKET